MRLEWTLLPWRVTIFRVFEIESPLRKGFYSLALKNTLESTA
jgi:hypothetical protein